MLFIVWFGLLAVWLAWLGWEFWSLKRSEKRFRTGDFSIWVPPSAFALLYRWTR